MGVVEGVGADVTDGVAVCVRIIPLLRSTFLVFNCTFRLYDTSTCNREQAFRFLLSGGRSRFLACSLLTTDQ